MVKDEYQNLRNKVASLTENTTYQRDLNDVLYTLIAKIEMLEKCVREKAT